MPSHFLVSARADSVSNALRHFEFKFGLSAWSVVFSSCTPQRQSSFAITFRLVNHHQPAISMEDQLNALPDPPAPAGAQKLAEPAQNLPQELEPIVEPAVAPAAPVEVTLFLFPLPFL